LTSIDKIEDHHCSIDQQLRSEASISLENHEIEKSQRITSEYANKYIEKGLSVIPTFYPGQSNFKGEKSDGKDPAVSTVIPYRERFATDNELRSWFANNDHNIGVLTGQLSSSFALDIDGENSKRDFQNLVGSMSKTLQDKVNNTMHVRTGGGNALIIFRYNKEDFPNGIKSEKIVAYPKHDEIMISGEGRYVVMPPSVHKSGKEYELLSDNLLTLTKDEVEELLSALKTIKTSITTRSDTIDINFTEKFAELHDAAITDIGEKLKIVYVDGSMHDMMLRFAGYARKYLRFKKEDLHKIAEIIHAGDTKNFDTIEDTYRKDLSEINGYHAFEEILQIITKNDDKIVSDIFSTLDKYKAKTSILEQLLPEIAVELKRHVFEVICYNPLNFVISHSDYKQIVDAEIDKIERTIKNKQGEEVHSINKLKIGDVIISAIPKKIICYDNPTHIESRYEIEFETHTGKVFTTSPKTIEEIIADLRSKGLVYNLRFAEQKLAAILNAYQKEGKVTVNTEIETPGFYMIEGKVVAYKTHHKEPTTDELTECTILLDELSIKWKQKELFPTYLKWGIVSPFNYVLKEHGNWMQWLYPYGWTRTGKSQLGIICALAIWRKDTDFVNHRIPFTGFDSVARIGHILSKSTFPIVVNECGALSDERNRHLVEMIKNTIENKTARGKFIGRHTYGDIPALSACILTSNSAPPADPAFRARIIPIRFTSAYETSDTEKKEFNEWLKNNVDKLGIIGDFAANYILKHQDILKNDWREIGGIILAELYNEARKPQPEWINYIVDESQIANAKEDLRLELRAFFLNEINNIYTKHKRTFEDDDGIKHDSLEERVTFCCRLNLIPFLLLHKEGNNIIITSDVIKELRRNKIDQIASLAELARILGFDYETVWTGRSVKAAHGKISKFLEFLEIK
jgi:hypothetical protein